MSGAAPAARDGLDPFHTTMGSGPDHLGRRGPTPGASGCPSGPRADRRRVRRLPHGRRRFKRAGSASWWIDARTKAFEAVARHLPQCRSRRITLKRHRERREEKPMQRRLLLHCAASTGDKLRVNTPAGARIVSTCRVLELQVEGRVGGKPSRRRRPWPLELGILVDRSSIQRSGFEEKVPRAMR